MSKTKLVKVNGTAYTEAEAKNKKYIVADAVKAAKIILTQMRIRECNAESVQKRDPEEKITLVELNAISDQIVSDSTYFMY